ncbi:MAG TPA: sigma-70 family RNA polymerase sigma factor [Gaiellaceae bacterium]|nr:sigma-70 family RNA polymerase sigma factor [Gaiellaceae bacterium]
MSTPARQASDRSTAAGGSSLPGAADAESSSWLRRLRSTGPERERALAELHELLLGAARFALTRRASQLGREGFDDLAVQAADDALVAVLARLDDYRGASRFTTWAWKFAFYEACAAVRKRSWLGREVPAEDSGWDALSNEASPDERLEQAELVAALRRAVAESLTPHQQRVFAALALNEVPVDVLAERLGTTRGALYKTLHEARSRLRAELGAAGLGPDRWQQAAPKWWRSAR